MKIVMTGPAENQRFAATGSHDLDPEGFLPAIIWFQVFECPNMMDFDLCGQVSGLTDFTNLRQESLFHFGVPCWLADQDGKPGDKLRAEIYQAIR